MVTTSQHGFVLTLREKNVERSDPTNSVKWRQRKSPIMLVWHRARSKSTQ